MALGLIRFNPALEDIIPPEVAAAMRVFFGLILSFVSFLERGISKINGKVWLLFVGMTLLMMGMTQFFPNVSASVHCRYNHNTITTHLRPLISKVLLLFVHHDLCEHSVSSG